MFLVASAAVFLGHRAQRCSATSVIPPAFVPRPCFGRGVEAPTSERRGGWDSLGASVGTCANRRSITPRTLVVSATSSSSTPTSAEGAAGGQSDATGSDGTGERRRKRGPKSLQERLNSMSLDFSLEDRDPYVAGAPRKLERSGATGGAGGASAVTSERPPSVRHSLYRRRKRPPSVLCMPRHQRPQGCAPLLPMENKDAVVDHIAQEQVGSGQLDTFKSDLPCVQSGTCPLPAFRCPKGHVWEANGTPVCLYCPICADSRVTALTGERRKKRDLEMIQQIAEERGGVCLSKTYLGMDRKLRFRCAEGHEWRTTPSNLTYKKTWCPTCAELRMSQRKRLDVAEMRRTALQFGGKFLSNEYLGAAVKHEWQCHRGHRFWQAPENIRRAEGGRRTATFCKKCTKIDKGIIRASVLAGIDERDVKHAAAALTEIGAMPTRRHFLPRKRKGKRAATPSDGGGESAPR